MALSTKLFPGGWEWKGKFCCVNNNRRDELPKLRYSLNKNTDRQFSSHENNELRLLGFQRFAVALFFLLMRFTISAILLGDRLPITQWNAFIVNGYCITARTFFNGTHLTEGVSMAKLLIFLTP